MFKEIELSEVESDGFLHSHIDGLKYDDNKKIFVIELTGADLKAGGIFYNCSITITDWWRAITSFTRDSKELNIDGLADLISKNPIDSAIYEYIIEESDITLNGHVSDCLFSLKFIKPKIQITGEYDPD